MIAIQTKYIPATNTLGSRIKAFTSNGQSLTLPFDYSADSEYKRYKSVALALCSKMNWNPDIIGGGTKNGYTFVFKYDDNE